MCESVVRDGLCSNVEEEKKERKRERDREKATTIFFIRSSTNAAETKEKKPEGLHRCREKTNMKKKIIYKSRFSWMNLHTHSHERKEENKCLLGMSSNSNSTIAVKDMEQLKKKRKKSKRERERASERASEREILVCD